MLAPCVPLSPLALCRICRVLSIFTGLNVPCLYYLYTSVPPFSPIICFLTSFSHLSFAVYSDLFIPFGLSRSRPCVSIGVSKRPHCLLMPICHCSLCVNSKSFSLGGWNVCPLLQRAHIGGPTAPVALRPLRQRPP